MNIQVSNLSLTVRDTDLRELFSAYGEVNTAVIVRSTQSDDAISTGLIDMINDTRAGQALTDLNNTLLQGRRMVLSEIRYSLRDHLN